MQTKQVDIEWLALILEAKKIGLSIREIKEFIHREQGKKATS